MYVALARGLSAALEPPERGGLMRGKLIPPLVGGLTSQCSGRAEVILYRSRVSGCGSSR